MASLDGPCPQYGVQRLGDLDIGLGASESQKLSMLRILCLQNVKNDIFYVKINIFNSCALTVIYENLNMSNTAHKLVKNLRVITSI